LSKEAEIRLEDLVTLFRQMLAEGSVQAPSVEVVAGLERHGLLTFKGMSPTRIAEIGSYCTEPDRDLEFREKGKKDLLALCRECLALQEVVHEAIRWRLGVVKPGVLGSSVDKFLAREE